MFASTIITWVLATASMAAAGPLVSPGHIPTPFLSNVLCNIAYYNDANVPRIDEGVDYLYKMEGNATLGHKEGGGAWCHRYSCAWSSAIYACNDNDHDVSVSWKDMAAYAHEARIQCNRDYFPGSYLVQGQAFSQHGWNVIVGFWQGEAAKC